MPYTRRTPVRIGGSEARWVTRAVLGPGRQPHGSTRGSATHLPQSCKLLLPTSSDAPKGSTEPANWGHRGRSRDLHRHEVRTTTGRWAFLPGEHLPPRQAVSHEWAPTRGSPVPLRTHNHRVLEILLWNRGKATAAAEAPFHLGLEVRLRPLILGFFQPDCFLFPGLLVAEVELAERAMPAARLTRLSRGAQVGAKRASEHNSGDSSRPPATRIAHQASGPRVTCRPSSHPTDTRCGTLPDGIAHLAHFALRRGLEKGQAKPHAHLRCVAPTTFEAGGSGWPL